MCGRRRAGYAWRMTDPRTELTDQELWDEFHRVVNMTSRELSDWLLTDASTESTTDLAAEHPTGSQVLAILGRRQRDVTDDDRRVMRKVVDRVHEQRRDDLEPTAGQAAWRHRLMSIGHDPLKPVE